MVLNQDTGVETRMPAEGGRWKNGHSRADPWSIGVPRKK